MVKFAIRYLRALVVMLVTMVIYSLAITPLIEPQQAELRRPQFSRELPNDHWWQEFFAEDAWQRQNPKIINTNQGILLSTSWDSIDEKTWRLAPLTMIMSQPSKAPASATESEVDERPPEIWLISAEQGATIHFEEPPEITGSTVPTIVRGDLSGEIHVTRQIAGQPNPRPWHLQTSNLTINRTQVSTRHQVRIEWDDSLIEGRELRLKLRGDLLSDKVSASAEWGPLDELELYHVDKIDLALPDGGIWVGLDPQRLNPEAPTEEQISQLPARISATCGGRFVFDFNRSTATLQNGVRVVHQLEGLPADEFLCERISFHVQPPRDEPSTAAGESPQLALGGIEFNRIEAVGIDSVQNFVGEQWVDLRLPTIDLTARSKRLNIDLKKQRVEFVGQLGHQNATRSTVTLEQRGNQFRAPHIEYQLPPQNDLGQADHLGWLFAEGPGELRARQAAALNAGPSGAEFDSGGGIRQDNPQTVRVRWRDSLRMRPVDQDGQGMQWIELLGNTLVESERQGFLTSDRLEIWLERYDSFAASDVSLRPGDSSSAGFRPYRIFSSQPTVLSMDAFRAEVAELDAVFDYVATDAEASAAQEVAPEVAGLKLSGSDGPNNGDLQRYVTQPGPTLPAPETSPADLGPRPNPIQVRGEKLKARIARTGEMTWIERLQLGGPVKVSQDAEAEWTEEPWRIEGDSLLMATEPSGEADLLIAGSPARMVLADGFLAGETIRLNQRHNLVVMDHPGEFAIPKKLLSHAQQKRFNQDSAGQPTASVNPNFAGQNPGTQNVGKDVAVEWFDAPHCKWSGRMIFDGSVVRIEGGVEFDAGLRTSPQQNWWVAGTSQLMEIFLSQPLRFDAQQQPQVALERIVLSDQVLIRGSELDGGGRRQSREEIRVPSLTFHAASGRLVGNGPGWLQSRFRSGAGLGQMASQGRGDVLSGAFLAFRDSMVASLDSKEVTFDGKIELLAGPIAGWDDAVRPDELDRLKPEQMLLNSDQLKVYDTGQLSTHAVGGGALIGGRDSETWEFKATGNVAFNGVSESGDFLGNGYQLTYVRLKNQLLLRGDGRTPAYLQRAPRVTGDSLLKAFVESVAINPETLEVSELRLAAGGIEVQPGSSNPNLNSRQPMQVPNQPGESSIPNPRQNFFDRGSRLP